jgi:radical SAM superfamily enzyme YgiQ (UPF0313 family)
VEGCDVTTPAAIQRFLDENSHRADAPFSWYGDEPNSYRKPWDEADVRACVFTCWPYEQAAGNQAVPLVYKTINEAEGMLCDRSYFPGTPRDLRLLTNGGMPIFGIESKHPLTDFDVVGTSISYPVLAINFVKQLAVSGITPSWDDYDDRGVTKTGRIREPERWPWVIVGGQAYGAPEVLSNIADAVWCGEVEDEPSNPGIVAVFEAVRDFKDAGLWRTDREDCYRRLAREFPFLYFPRFYDIGYGYERRPTVDRVLGRESELSKQVTSVESNLEGMSSPVVKRFVHDLDAVAPLDNPPLLYNDPGLGAGDLEVGRGCPAWCSFCALTYRQKPYRQRSVEYVVDFGKRLLQNTGGIHLAPFSPDFPMHTNKKRLLKALLAEASDDIDMSSMRVDDFIADPSYVMLQAAGGVDTVTLGVEGNSQRMRDFVGKGAADEDVKEAVARAIRAGIKRIKMYMIAFMPGEDEGDVYRLLSLAREIADIRDGMGSSARIQFSWTPMLIEGNTPFQWFAPTTINFALSDVWEELRRLHIDFKLGSKVAKDKLAFQQLSQRCNRLQGKALMEAAIALDAGCWGGVPEDLYETIEARLYAQGFHNGFADAFDERFKDDMFGWEHIDQGINVELMWVTYQQMREFLENTDSESYDRQFSPDYHGNEWIERCDTKCQGKTCGVCDARDLRIRRGYIEAAADEATVDLTALKVIDQRTVALKVRAKAVRDDQHRFVTNDHLVYAVRRAAYRAGMPISKRTVKFASSTIKYKNWASGVDYVEFGLTRRINPAEVSRLVGSMNSELGSALHITDAVLVPSSVSPLRSDVGSSLYDMEVDVPIESVVKAIERWHASEYVKAVVHERKATGMVREEVNAKDYVDDLWAVRDGHRVRLRFYLRGVVNPYAIYAALFGKPSWIEAARYPVHRLGSFMDIEAAQNDFLRPACVECGMTIPVDLLDRPWDAERCPRCADSDVVLEAATA